MNQSERRNFLIQSLLEESREYRGMQIPSDSTGQRQLLRGLMNVRMVKKSSAEFLNIQDAYLQEETAKKGVTDVDDLRNAALQNRRISHRCSRGYASGRAISPRSGAMRL